MSRPGVSLVVVAYDMARELPRTLKSLSAGCQRHVSAGDYEVIVVDNGSREPFDAGLCRELCPNARFLHLRDAGVSPVLAINTGLAEARADLVGVMIDGARMASPGLVATALQASRLHPCPVIGTLAFHLGPDVQMRSVQEGYDEQVEDDLLGSVDWVTNGYELFSISVFAASSAKGWFVLPSETNALFLRRGQWDVLGGYDDAFLSPGGGLVNLDTWVRACALPGTQVMLLLGEATFHQVHGGIATNAPRSRWEEFHDEYVRIRGRRFVPPAGTPLMVGRMPPQARTSMLASLGHLPSGGQG